jgi:pyrroline-5-carboxylate reductase
MAKIAMLGTGFIADFYISALHGQRSRDRVIMAYSTTKERAEPFAAKHQISHIGRTTSPKPSATPMWTSSALRCATTSTSKPPKPLPRRAKP